VGFANGHVLRVVLSGTDGQGVAFVNVLHYDLENATGGANDPQSLADTFRDDVIPAYRSLLLTDSTINPVVVQDERDPQFPFGPRAGWTSGAPTAGTRNQTTERLPAACTAVATLITDHIGRRYRGRIFLPGQFTESDQQDGNFVATTKARLQAFLDVIPRQPDISPAGSTSTAVWSVFSRTQRTANLDPYLSKVTATQLRTPLHWLRSRER